MLSFSGVHAEILADTTPEIAVIGGRGSGKSTVCVTKEIRHLKQYPGMKSFLFRLSEKDTESKLIPFFREMCAEEEEYPAWDAKESCFKFGNGSIAFMFGLRATNAAQRYSKLRGLGVARAFCDQTEELDTGLGSELRAALRQPNFPKQLTYCANPPDWHHWLAKEFPPGVETRFRGRKLYQISLYQNPHFPADGLRELEVAYPPSHPNYKSLILGQYGTSVTGETIYGKVFERKHHVRHIDHDPKAMLFECFDFGKLNPCWLTAQRPYTGGLYFLGGIIGFEMFLEDFIPIVLEHRSQWFPNLPRDLVRTCCTLSCRKDEGRQLASVQFLRNFGFAPVWKEGSNSPDVVLSVIERQASYLRRRGADGREMLGVNSAEDRWLRVSSEGIDPSPFMAYAFEGGYAWADKNVSVGRNEIKQPQSDEWYEFPMRCAEAIELNFGAQSRTQAELDEAKTKQARQQSTPIASGPHGWLGT